MNVLRKLEKLFLVVGLTLLGIFAIAKLHNAVMSKASIASFNAAKLEQAKLAMPLQEDFDLWAPHRIDAYRKSLTIAVDAPMAVLRVPRLKIEVPVLKGTDEFALNRGVGWIDGTAVPGESGNVGIAGHRDGFFRALKDVKVGDSLQLETLEGKDEYLVDEIEIVAPSDSAVLRPRAQPSVTLVTCYPFYFVGDAPKRFIVHASLGAARAQSKGSLNSQNNAGSDRRN